MIIASSAARSPEAHGSPETMLELTTRTLIQGHAALTAKQAFADVDGKRIQMPSGGPEGIQVALSPTPEETVHPDQLTLGG